MFTVSLPYEIGTFVKVKASLSNSTRFIGTVSAYTVTDPNKFLIWVSAYKNALAAECLPEDVVPLNESEIELFMKSYEEG